MRLTAGGGGGFELEVRGIDQTKVSRCKASIHHRAGIGTGTGKRGIGRGSWCLVTNNLAIRGCTVAGGAENGGKLHGVHGAIVLAFGVAPKERLGWLIDQPITLRSVCLSAILVFPFREALASAYDQSCIVQRPVVHSRAIHVGTGIDLPHSSTTS